MDNVECSTVFRDIAQLLALQGDDPFRIRAYHRAAQTLASLPVSVRVLARRQALETIPSIGKTLAREIEELLETGHVRYYERLRTTVPEGLLSMLRLPSLSPDQVRTLWRKQHITSMKHLAQAYQDGRVLLDEGTLAALGSDIAQWERAQHRMLLGLALPRAEVLMERFERLTLVTQVGLAGSTRRGAAMVGDINIVLASPDPPRLMQLCNKQPEIRQVLETGPTSTVVVTSEGLRVSLVAVLPAQFVHALHYYTGSAAHLSALRQRAQGRGVDLSPYGIVQLANGRYLTLPDDDALYDSLGLPYIPPELREGDSAIEAALASALPALVSLDDIRGDLHVQSDWGQGAHSLAQLVQIGQRLGYQYVAVCDYMSCTVAERGLTSANLAAQLTAIKQLNRTLPETFRLLAGVEVEITPDGALDADLALLQDLDLVIATAHTGLKATRQQLTRRLCKAMEHPVVDILAHPMGRMLGCAEFPQVDSAALLETAVDTGTVLELNTHLLRLDLPDTVVRQARDLGVTLALGSEAQNIREMHTIRLGVLTARRGWLEPAQLLNTLPYVSLLRRVHERSISHVL